MNQSESQHTNDSDTKQEDFVCTWCGTSWPTSSELKRHWLRNPECNNQRTVSNPTQTKYNTTED